MKTKSDRSRERELLRTTIARLRASVVAVVFGLTSGTGLFIATAWLIIRGGQEVGVHLSLLNNYFPGYSVTWPGSFVGFFYGTLTGAIAGWSVGWIYNEVVDWRQAS